MGDEEETGTETSEDLSVDEEYEFVPTEDDIDFGIDPADDDEPRKTRAEKKRERGALLDELKKRDDEIEALRKRQEERDKEYEQRMEQLRNDVGRGFRTLATSQQPRGESKLDTLYKEQDDLERYYASRQVDKQRPITDDEYRELKTKARKIDEQIAEARYEQVRARHEPNEEQRVAESVASQMRSEFPREMGDERVRKVAAAEVYALTSRGKPLTTEMARNVLKKLSVEFGFSRQNPEPSDAEKAKTRGTRSAASPRSDNGKVVVKPGSVEETLALRMTEHMSDKVSKKDRIRHWVNQISKQEG